MALIFIGGIHGAGKSTLCSTLAARFDVQHVSAGQIINNVKKLSAEGKKVSDIYGNQDALIAGLKEYRNQRLLLDGHFSVLTPAGIEAIPLDIFSRISPVALLLITVNPADAAQRLADRDGQAYSEKLLGELQIKEIKHARKVADQIKVPLNFLDSYQIDDAVRFIREKAWVNK